MTCKHCGQPIKPCDDLYVGHDCDGWRHGDGFHGCDWRYLGASSDPSRRAEPEVTT